MTNTQAHGPSSIHMSQRMRDSNPISALSVQLHSSRAVAETPMSTGPPEGQNDDAKKPPIVVRGLLHTARG
jgi:hypothetical protein